MKDLYQKAKKDYTERYSNSIKLSKDRDKWRWHNNWGCIRKTPKNTQIKRKEETK